MKKLPEDYREWMKVHNRKRRGWSETEAKLPDVEFKKLSAAKRGKYFVNGLNLNYVCEKFGLKYNTIAAWLNRHEGKTPEDYFKMKGMLVDDFIV